MANSANTLGMKVENTGFLLDRLGRDCAPLQFLRELTQNGVEAILRTPEKTGTVLWGLNDALHDLPMSEEDKRFKLCVVDTGIGMTGEEMALYINNLSSSSGIQSHVQNYGVGAKIAAATRNPAGLVYLSWKNGEGSMVHLWRDPDTLNYGLKRFDLGDGQYSYWTRASDLLKPDIIKDHGTVVILLGDSEEANTVLPPENTPQLALWVTKYLNTRYFEFPEGVNVKAHELSIGQSVDRGEDESIKSRTIRGQKAYLSQYSDSSGVLQLSNAKAHWWILKDDPNISRMASYWASGGHTAALYQRELYETSSGRSSTAMLQEFGITLGYQRVVIYVQPDLKAFPDITTDTARTRLLVNKGEPLPWADWAAEFRDKLPAEIVDLIDSVGHATTGASYSERILARLEEVKHLLDSSRLKAKTGGPLKVNSSSTRPAPEPHSPVFSTGHQNTDGGKKPPRETIGNILTAFADNGNIAAQRSKAMEIPSVRWLSIDEGTRSLGDDLEDRAARYIASANELHINGDFSVFRNVINDLCGIHSDKQGINLIATETVREWYQQSLIEMIASARSLTGSKGWPPDAIKGLLSEEGLTGAVFSGRWLHWNRIKSSVSVKIGKVGKAKRPEATMVAKPDGVQPA
jgi:hypothetical protein